MQINNNPLVTVLMPVYNGKKYLAEAIDSILNQTYKNFEFLIINDGSEDNTEKIILSYNDERIRYLKNNQNLGIIKTLNKGLKLCKGKYIARMDADDIALPYRIKEQVSFMEKELEVAVSGSWTKNLNTIDIYLNKVPTNYAEIKSLLFFRNSMVHSSIILRSNIILNNFLYDQEYLFVEDYELWYRISQKYKLANIPKVLLKYRDHPENISSKNKKEQDENSFKVALRQLQLFLNRRVISDKELMLHRIILGLNKNHSISIKDISSWCNLLWKINQNTGQYNKRYFSRHLTFAWKTALKSSKYNISSLTINYFIHFIIGKVSFDNISCFFKMVYKCLLDKICN